MSIYISVSLPDLHPAVIPSSRDDTATSIRDSKKHWCGQDPNQYTQILGHKQKSDSVGKSIALVEGKQQQGQQGKV
jgi:hypothetical protein